MAAMPRDFAGTGYDLYEDFPEDSDYFNNRHQGDFNGTAYPNYEYFDPVQMGINFKTVMFLYVSPILLLVGVFGNCTSLAVLRSRSFRKMPPALILSFLAVTDIGVLNTALPRHWILALTEDRLDIRAFNNFTCKGHCFLTYLLPQLSSWTLALMTLQRLFFVIDPFTARTMSRSKLKWRMTIIWLAILLTLMCINAHALTTFGIVLDQSIANGTANLRCEQNDSFFMNNLWPPLDGVLSCFLPGIVILASNIIVIQYKGRMRRRSAVNSSGANASNGGSDGNEIRIHRTNDDAQSRSINVMLISISALFIVTTVPATVYFIRYSHVKPDSAMAIYRNFITFTIVNLLMYANYACNFVMYCVSGALFRRTLGDMVCCRTTPNRGSVFSQTLSQRQVANGGGRRQFLPCPPTKPMSTSGQSPPQGANTSL